MLISVKDKTSPDVIVAALRTHFEDTRFVLGDIDRPGPKRIKLRTIRLREKKFYCGNHPNECEAIIGGSNQGRGRKGVWLEGADWVEFNDRINDVLDALGCAANVRTSVCELRNGYCRRIEYSSHMEGHFYQWDMSGAPFQYEDWCGRDAPASEYPYGTPGEYHREVNA